METIQFLICTIDDRIQHVEEMLLPSVQGVKYLVSWQRTCHWLEAEQRGEKRETNATVERLRHRTDVSVTHCQGTGLSRNRNHALQEATGDLLVISDDDCRYSPKSIDTIRQAFKEYPDTTLIQFQGTDFKGNPIHEYPDNTYEYGNRPYGTFFCSWELVVRNRSSLPQFDERFGIGAYLGCGEEEVFVHQIAQMNLTVRYLPIKLVQTNATTTGDLFWKSKAVQRAKGGVLSIMHGGASAFLRCIKFVWNAREISIRNKFKCLVQTTKGIIYVHTHHPLP